MSRKGIGTTVAVVLAIVALAVGLFAGITIYPTLYPPEAPKPVGLSGQVQIGALFSMSGDLATFGENEKAAAELAVEEINAFLKNAGANWTVKLVVEDTQAKPDLALLKLESLAGQGIKLIIGPLSSGEVRKIKGYCDSNKILVISQSSTAPDLAVADDYIFRFCPTDKLGQGPALARLMYDNGTRYIIPVTRNDAWGVGLENATKKKFEELGGQFLEGIRYSIEATTFDAEASDLNTKVTNAVNTYGADKVAVFHISFEEVTTFFTACKDYANVKKVKWYGSDGTAGSSAMLTDTAVRDFAYKVSYPCTIFSPTRSDKWEKVRQNGWAKLGREPDSYSYAVYDVVWAYAYALLTVNKYNATAIKEVVPTVTESLFGASGWIQLDEAGDRKAGDYDIWMIAYNATAQTYDWKIVGTYVLGSDSVQWK